MLSHEFDCFEKILFESVTEAVSLIVEICDCFVSLGFGRRKEANLPHLLRALRRPKTSSAGTASMLPAL